MTPPFALLDDGRADPDTPASRLYTGFVAEHRCTDPAHFAATWAAVERDQRAGAHAVLLADYEWGARLIGAPHVAALASEPAALRVLMFDSLQRLAAAQVERWLAAGDDGQPAGSSALHESVSDHQFHAAIARIHEAIADGETYQVNYTYRLNGTAYGSPLALYRRLRARQPVPYGALIALPERADDARRWVLSCSPELFVRHDGGRLTARPMKGTARRVTNLVGDSETARELAADIKNRAENLMIVDLLRNDLGRVAQIGSVQVPELFRIEPYATVFQMTSTVQAQRRPEVGLPELLRAVFPCGSITGAPKHHTMALIAQLESTPRGLYCGAIGWVDAAPAAASGDCGGCGDFCLSVAIRTLTLAAPLAGADAPPQRPLRLGIGAGIVQDSVAADELAECRLKARFLTSLPPTFELFETLRAEPGVGIARQAAHLARLAASAQALGFEFDLAEARRLLAAAAAAATVPTRLRLALAADGRLDLRSAALAPLATLPVWPKPPSESLPSPPRFTQTAPDRAAPVATQGPGTWSGSPDPAAAPVGALIAAQRLPDAPLPLAGHKTTLRAHYDAGIRAAEAAGAFDSLFFTADGRLVEGGRSNVFIRLHGRWLTPPLADGALPGVMRAALLANPALAASEQSLRLDDLRQADTVWLCNALRGVLAATVVGLADAPHDAPAPAPAPTSTPTPSPAAPADAPHPAARTPPRA